MAKTQTVEEHAELRDRLAPPGSMPPAPVGSADRVRDDDLLPFDADEGDSVVSPGANDGSILVNDYDANGEAIARQVPIEPAQTPMPGFEKPEIWDRFEGRKISKVILSFAGTCDLSRDPDLCRRLRLREEVAFTIEGEVTGKAFKLRTDKNGVTSVDGVATINVTGVAGEGRSNDLEAVREAAYAAAIEQAIGIVEQHTEAGESIAQLLGRLRATALMMQLEDDPDDEASSESAADDEPSALDASLAEALAE